MRWLLYFYRNIINNGLSYLFYDVFNDIYRSIITKYYGHSYHKFNDLGRVVEYNKINT